MRSSLFLLAAVLALKVSSTPVFACAACFGQSDSSMAQGLNVGIFALLFVITSVLCGIAGFFIYVARRGAHLEQTAAEHLPDNFSEPQTNA
jgi:hypothetical protein